MKMIIVALALVAIASALPVSEVHSEPIKILREEFDRQPEGAYVFSYETENGISRNEVGDLKEALDEENKPHSVVVVRGSYAYTDDQGKPQTITYYADETGFHAEGDSIPKAVSRR